MSTPRYSIWTPVPDQLIESTANYLATLPLKCSSRTHTFQFVKRLVYRGKLSSSVLASSMVYLDRLVISDKMRFFEATSLELAFVASILLASKFLDDRGLSVFKVIGITRDVWTSSQVCEIERQFLHHLSYNLWLTMEDVNKFSLKQ